jgi:hypothetical protein
MFAIPGPVTASIHTVETLVWVWEPTSELGKSDVTIDLYINLSPPWPHF